MPDPATDPQDQRQARRAELEATQRQISAYQHLLEEVPAVFERKFRERLQPLLERNRQIAEQGHQLREQIAAVVPVRETPSRAAEPVADEPQLAGQEEDAGLDDPEGDSPWSLRAPLMQQRLLWGLLGTIAGLGLALLLIGTWTRRSTPPQPRSETKASAGITAPANTGGASSQGLGKTGTSPRLAPDELLLQSRGSWLELRDQRGRRLFIGVLHGERRFRIGSGLNLNAGRPDLVTIRIGAQPAKVLGSIETVGWRQIQPSPQPARGSSPRPGRDARQP